MSETSAGEGLIESVLEKGVADAVAERGAMAWVEASERVLLSAQRLAAAGPPSAVVEAGAGEAALAVGLDRVLLSRLEAGSLVVEGFHPRLRASPTSSDPTAGEQVSLRYPLIEAEVVRRRKPLLVRAGEVSSGAPRKAFMERMGWGDYLAVPVVLESQTIGFLHGDRQPPSEPVGALELEALWRFAAAFAGVFERAVLRRRLRVQRQRLREVATWADARTADLSDSAINLGTDREPTEAAEPLVVSLKGNELGEDLTQRELEVLEHMVKGGSNADIARALVVSDSTVKFHVKNVLRKLGVANRAEATSKYLRMTMGDE